MLQIKYNVATITAKKGSGVDMKPSGVGGMAVIEGVMMKNKDEYAVAVRKPDNEIVVEKKTYKSFSEKVKLFKLPVFRGMLAFVDSMVIGVKILSYSASFFEEEEQLQDDKKKKTKDKEDKAKNKKDKAQNIKAEVKNKDKNIKKISHETAINSNNSETQESMKEDKKEDGASALLIAAAVVVSIGIATLLFMVLPVLASHLFSRVIKNNILLNLLEGVMRIVIFVVYVTAVSQMQDIKRVFMYHGAEHKTINCLENGFELSVENVKWQSKLHKRCGTSFMLIVMFISVIFFIFVPVEHIALRIITRILLVPFIAGVSYEFLRLAGKSNSKIVNVLSIPGLWMQGLTTREPDDAMIEVAIKSVETVFDWKSFLEDEDTDKVDTKKTKSVNKKSKEKEQPVVTTEIKPVTNPIRKGIHEEEEDDILKALDKYLDFGEDGSSNIEENRKVM